MTDFVSTDPIPMSPHGLATPYDSGTSENGVFGLWSRRRAHRTKQPCLNTWRVCVGFHGDDQITSALLVVTFRKSDTYHTLRCSIYGSRS